MNKRADPIDLERDLSEPPDGRLECKNKPAPKGAINSMFSGEM
jgi:hypothetical protein